MFSTYPIAYFDFLGLLSNCMECIIQCNEVFKWDEENRRDKFLSEWIKCESYLPPKLSGCRTGAIFLDQYLNRSNRRKLQLCLNGCAENECNDEEKCY
jgi:hypothetical protein